MQREKSKRAKYTALLIVDRLREKWRVLLLALPFFVLSVGFQNDPHTLQTTQPENAPKTSGSRVDQPSSAAMLKPEKNCRWSLCGEFLYWNISDSQSDYVVERTKPKNGQLPFKDFFDAGSAFFGDLYKHKFHWGPGFRLSTEYKTDKDDWSLIGLYTYFHRDSFTVKNLDYGPFNYLNGTLIQITESDAIRASSGVKFRSDVAQLDLARSFKVSKTVALQFIAGAIASWIDMKWHVDFTGNDFSINQVDWKFKGGGLDIGLKSLWNIFSHLNFCLDGGVSALYGTHTNSFNALSDHADAAAILSDSDHRFVWKTNLKSGFSWLQKCTSFGFELFVGVEVNTWFNLNENYRPLMSLPYFTNSAVENERPRFLDSCPLNLYGFTTKLNLSF